MLYHLIFVYSYLIYGFLSIYCTYPLSSLYLVLLLFLSLKLITNYRVCSVAYMECKIMGIKREDSLMNRFLDPIVDMRYTDHIYPVSILSFLILTYNLVYLKRIQEMWNDF